MNTTLIKEDLINLRKVLPEIEDHLLKQIESIQTHDDYFNSLDKKAELMINENPQRKVKLNIGGKCFTSMISTLLSQKDTLFYKLILSDKVSLDEEIYIDRNPRLFHVFLDYLRNKVFDLNLFPRSDYFELLLESSYYNLPEITKKFANMKKGINKELEYVGFEFNGPYYCGSVLAGTNNVEDLLDKSCMKGICATSPGWIIIEFNDIFDFEELEIAGWGGNSGIWAASNGSNSRIEVSIDKVVWNNVGTIPSTYSSSIIPVKLTKSVSARFIKFVGTSSLGIGFLKIKTD